MNQITPRIRILLFVVLVAWTNSWNVWRCYERYSLEHCSSICNWLTVASLCSTETVYFLSQQLTFLYYSPPPPTCLHYHKRRCGGYSRLFSLLLSPASESDERYSRSTLFNVLEGQTERFVTSVVRFLRNSPLSSKTVHTSRLLASVYRLQQFTAFQNRFRQALHCPSYS